MFEIQSSVRRLTRPSKPKSDDLLTFPLTVEVLKLFNCKTVQSTATLPPERQEIPKALFPKLKTFANARNCRLDLSDIRGVSACYVPGTNANKLFSSQKQGCRPNLKDRLK
jgi:hypothetical protein